MCHETGVMIPTQPKLKNAALFFRSNFFETFFCHNKFCQFVTMHHSGASGCVGKLKKNRFDNF
jgi:hypothetical protein